MPNKPLTGIKVVDFTRVLAGPYCAMLLADLGADVVKVEMPGSGDAIRRQGPPFFHGNGMTYLAANRNKRSLGLNLKADRGNAIARRLCMAADVVIENFRPDVMPRLGLGYDELSQSNPRLIYASISGFGATGPDSVTGGFDLTVQALGGYMSVTGAADGRPIKLGTSAFDLIAGMNCQAAIMAALLQRISTGRGQKVETSLLEGQVVFLADQALDYLMHGTLPRKHGAAHANRVPCKVFRAADGWLLIDASRQDRFVALLGILGRSKLADDTRFADALARSRNAEALYEMLDAAIASRTCSELRGELDADAVPCTRINDIEAALAHCRATQRDMIHIVRHPVYGELPQVGSAASYSAFDIHAGWTAPPLPGEHSAEVLRDWLGISQNEVDVLAADRII
ncbi:CoA transferase [Candidimonas humi]|uniref:CaiB/BaiF CoA transferase family protein n=1 Tax=Candidimonas humi TaxID=683355 RepID=A0ABV8P146_9BURK|nr:CaiB/BaiF CoA-transferase family protein [Candidimonas humi]MBV6306121.1 CoA transferase [Candidimonas humi]